MSPKPQEILLAAPRLRASWPGRIARYAAYALEGAARLMVQCSKVKLTLMSIR